MKVHFKWIYSLFALVIIVALVFTGIHVWVELIREPDYSPELDSLGKLEGSIPDKEQDKNASEDDIPYGHFDITFLGNCSLGSLLGSDIYGTLNDVLAQNSKPMTDFRELLLSDDITFSSCNSVFSDNELTAISKDSEDGKWILGYASNASFYSANGIDAVSVETAHINDYGDKGVTDTYAALEAAGVTALSSVKPFVFEKDGYTVTVLTMRFTENNPSCLYAIRVASYNSDLVLVYGEAVDEGDAPSQWRIDAAKAMIDAGADAVVQYTSVLQAVKYYNDGIIAYSIGNFIDGSEAPNSEDHSIVLNLKFTVGYSFEITPTLIPATAKEAGWFPSLIHNPDEADRILGGIRP